MAGLDGLGGSGGRRARRLALRSSDAAPAAPVFEACAASALSRAAPTGHRARADGDPSRRGGAGFERDGDSLGALLEQEPLLRVPQARQAGRLAGFVVADRASKPRSGAIQLHAHPP